jgi:hypothetical protein
MTIARPIVKKSQTPSMPKQLLATGLILFSGLVVFLIIGFIAPKSSSLIDAGKDYDTTNTALTTVVPEIPGLGAALSNAKDSVKSPPPAISLDLTRGFILSNQDKKLPQQFEIPESLRKSVAVWFDLFTKYSNDSWVIISSSPSAAIVEEWSKERLFRRLGEPLNQQRIRLFLNERLRDLKKKPEYGRLFIQAGLKEDFLQNARLQQKWQPIIEEIFEGQKLDKEYARFFLIPKNRSRGERTAPWTALQSSIVNQYLLQTDFIDETKSPVKIARAFANHLKSAKTVKIRWKNHFNSPTDLDAAFYAALYIEAYAEELQLKLKEGSPSQGIKAFKLARETSVENLVKDLNLSLTSFLMSNPDLVAKNPQIELPKAYVFFVEGSRPKRRLN